MGGFQEKDLSATRSPEEIQEEEETIRFAIAYYERNFNEELGEVEKIETQVVSGINYKIYFRKGDKTVKITVWVQSWTDTMEVVNVEEIDNQ